MEKRRGSVTSGAPLEALQRVCVCVSVHTYVHACLVLPSSCLIKDLTFFSPSIDQTPPEHVSGVNGPGAAASAGSLPDGGGWELGRADCATMPQLRPGVRI